MRPASHALVRTFLALENLEERAVPATGSLSPTIREATGVSIASITPARDQFRVDLGGGTSAGVDGSFGGLRREINWDAVPESSSSPNPIAGSFFNSTTPRGAVFSTPGTGFQVSSDGSSAAVNFGNINGAYTTTFEPFSTTKLFTPIGSNVTEVAFFAPGTNQPALVRGFGAVFTDVDQSNATKIELFDFRGNLICERFVQSTAGNATFSFLGLSFSEAIIARVRITTGEANLSASTTDGLGTDLVVMDDFLYSEPIRYSDLVIMQSATPIAREGDAVTFTIRVSNNGPNIASGARVLDQFPNVLSNVAWTTTSTGGAVAPANGVGPIDAIVDLPVGSSVTFNVTAILNARLTDNLLNSAVVLAPSVTIDPDASSNTALATIAYNRTPPGDRFAVGTLPGTAARVNLYNQAGAPTLNLQPYGDFTGGVNVATGDINGDGIDDVITSPILGTSHIKVYNGANGSLLYSFYAYSSDVMIGASVASGDINGDGFADIITGAARGGGPHVRVFSGRDGTEITSFFAYQPEQTFGVIVASGDINGDGRADILTVPGAGVTAHFRAFSGIDLAILQSFYAVDPSITSGVSLAAGDVNASGRDSILFGLGQGNPAIVLVYGGTTGNQLTRSFVAYASNFLGGVAISSIDANGDGVEDILTAAGPNGGPHVLAVGGNSSDVPIMSFFAYEQSVTSGLTIG